MTEQSSGAGAAGAVARGLAAMVVCSPGTTIGATWLRSGISMGISTGIGLGWLSNSSGKPTTPSKTSTAAPINRCLARRRMVSMLSAGAAREDRAGLALTSCPFWPGHRNLKNAMSYRTQCQAKCLACNRGMPSSSTPPTV